MKYKVIYDVIYASGGTTMQDRSPWRKPNMDIVERNRPLWLILENQRVNLRLWVTHEYGELRISTAQLNLDCNSKAYHESYRRYVSKTQKDMADLLRRILSKDKEVPA